MKIAIDIDNTILDCNSFFYKIANAALPKQKSSKKLKYKRIQNIKDSKEGIFNKIFKMLNYRYYAIKQGAQRIINKWHNEGHEITLLSSRPGSKSFAKVLMFCINKFDIHCDHIVVACNNKSLFCKENNISLIIDDSLDTCKQCNLEGIFSIHYDEAKKNDNIHKHKILSADSWDEIDEEVTKIKKSNLLVK